MRKAVKQFAESMEERLKENDYKGGWEDCSLAYLEARLVEELGEYYGAKAMGDTAPEEMVDIANFAMMVWEKSNG